jgi:arginase
MSNAISIIGAPSSAGAHAGGQEKAPAALRAAGLLKKIRQSGADVIDLGDTAEWRWKPDRDRPRAQNLERVIGAAKEVSRHVERIRRKDRFALVLGGDCTIEIGTVLGHLDCASRIGLVYLDMHADMNVPTSVPGGALDWMGVAHMLGCPGAIEPLARLAPSFPVLRPEQVVILGHRPDQATAFEREEIRRLRVATVDIDDVARDPAAAAEKALAVVDREADALLVHFDVDVIDFTDAPLSENTGRNIGLSQQVALAALGVLMRHPRVTSLTVTELNPDHADPDGSTVSAFVDGLAAALRALNDRASMAMP